MSTPNEIVGQVAEAISQQWADDEKQRGGPNSERLARVALAVGYRELAKLLTGQQRYLQGDDFANGYQAARMYTDRLADAVAALGIAEETA